MKIGIVCYPTFGGSGVVATELGKGLADRGHQIHFITYNQPARFDSFNANLFYHEVNLPDYPLFDHIPYETALASKLVDVVKKADLDLLHVHYAIPHAAVAYMAKKILLADGRYTPVITTLHGTDISIVGINESYAPVVTFSINKSDGVTAVSDSLKKQTYELFDIKRDIQVIPNFIDFDRFSKSDKEHFKKAIAPNGERIVMHTSNFRKVKRVDDVIAIFKRISDALPSKLLLIGDGPLRGAMEKLAQELGLGDSVRFLGKQSAVEELLAIGDLFLMPSGSESFGLAALEAMACEVPVISSNVGGLPEVNIHGKTGFLSEVGNVEEMAANAIKILSDDKMLETFRKNAMEQAKTFSIEHILPQYEAYYEHILSTEVYK